MLAYVVAIQAAAVAGPPLDIPRNLSVTSTCKPDPADPDAVVVCARRDQPYRLKPLPPLADQPALPKAETTLFGKVRAGVEVEQGNLGPIPTNRVMFRLKMPF